MIDHVSVGVKSLKKAKEFYDSALKPLGYSCVYTVEIPGEGVVAHGYGEGEKPSFWIGKPERFDKKANRKGGTHVAFVAKSRKAIDAFHKAAIKAGAKDNGAPGLRPHYHPNYYGAFVIDLNGVNLEAVCHKPA